MNTCIRKILNYNDFKGYLKIDLGKFIFLLTLLYSLFYLGAIPSNTKSAGLLYELFLLISPSIIGYFLIHYFKSEQLKIANGDVLSWTHADLQTDFFDVIRAYNKYQSENNSDLIIKGKRKNRNFIDAFFTWGMQRYTGIKLKVKLNDINAQPKLFSKSFYKKYLSLAFVDFSLDLFLLIKSNQSNLA